MGRVIFDTLTREQFLKLPETKPPLEYIDGLVVQKRTPPRLPVSAPIDTRRVIYDSLTLKQFLKLPEAKPALEYIDGMVVQKVPPKRTHSSLQGEFILQISSFARPRRIGRIYPELRCTFGGRALVPDLSFFRRGRIPRDASGKPVEDVLLPPDLAIEIISPGQTIRDLTARLSWCVHHGVELAWLIQPRKERAFVFRPNHPIETLERDQALDGEQILPAFRIALDDLFSGIDED
jgi:Uma2 family endonuclease